MTSMQKVEEGAEKGPSHGKMMMEASGQKNVMGRGGRKGQKKGERKEGGKARPFVSSIDKKKRVGGRG